MARLLARSAPHNWMTGEYFAARGRPGMGRLPASSPSTPAVRAGGRRFQQTGQTIVEMAHTRQEVQHALVDAHARGGKLSPPELDQAPRRNGPAGDSALQWGSSRAASAKPKVGNDKRGPAGQRRPPGKAGIEFDAGAEQQGRSFETRQAKGAA